MSNLALRFLTAGLLIPLLVAAIHWKEPYGVWLWVFFAQLAGLREWMAMTLPTEPVSKRFGVIVGTLCALALFWLPNQVPGETLWLLVLCGATLATLLFFLLRPGPIETVAVRIS